MGIGGVIKGIVGIAGNANPITAVVSTVLDRVIPDKAANDAAKAKLAEMDQAGDLQEALGQIQIDVAEAQSKSTFVAGWRPFIGWTCGAALAYSYVIQPFLVAVVIICGVHFDVSQLPKLDMVTLIGLLSTMLGMGILRTVDKANGQGGGH